MVGGAIRSQRAASGSGFRLLVRNRAGQFTEAFHGALSGAGIEVVQILPRSPEGEGKCREVAQPGPRSPTGCSASCDPAPGRSFAFAPTSVQWLSPATGYAHRPDGCGVFAAL